MDSHEDVGYLTWRQFETFRWAIDQAMKLVPWLYQAGFVSMGDDVSVQTSSTGWVNLAPTWMAAEEVNRLMQELNQFPELEDAANDKYGQFLALELTREVQTALHRWPYEDKPHRVQGLRCFECERLTLTYRPPRHYRDDVLVDCFCGYSMSEDEFTLACELIAMEEREKQKGQKAIA